jgi:peroxiredoxin
MQPARKSAVSITPQFAMPMIASFHPSMRRRALVAAMALCAASVHAALKDGDSAPDFVATASLNGQPFRYVLADALKKGPVVVYFYPAAFTSGCSVQAHTFSVQHEAFTAAGASIVGVSLDNIARLNEFSADPQSCAGKLAVASDSDGRVSRAYEVSVRDAVSGRKDNRGAPIDHGFADRTTFVIGTDGRIAATVGGVSPVENVERALAAVRKLNDKAR